MPLLVTFIIKKMKLIIKLIEIQVIMVMVIAKAIPDFLN